MFESGHSQLSWASLLNVEVEQMDDADRRLRPAQARGDDMNLFNAAGGMSSIPSNRGGQPSHGTSYFQQGAAAMQRSKVLQRVVQGGRVGLFCGNKTPFDYVAF